MILQDVMQQSSDDVVIDAQIFQDDAGNAQEVAQVANALTLVARAAFAELPGMRAAA